MLSNYPVWFREFFGNLKPRTTLQNSLLINNIRLRESYNIDLITNIIIVFEVYFKKSISILEIFRTKE